MFPSQGQFHGRTEIVPDQKEKFLHRLQQVQQQGHSNLLGMTPLAENSKQMSTQQQNLLSQQVLSFSTTFFLSFEALLHTFLLFHI